MKSTLCGVVACAVAIGLLAHSVPADERRVAIELPDGRSIPGSALHRSRGGATIETFFGPLRLEKEHLKATSKEETAPENPPEERRTTTSTWFRIDSDITGSRAKLYHEYLDAFVLYMVKTYDLDVEKMKREAPFDIHVYRSRADYKRIQDERAAGIAGKGKDFAEKVVGFYSPGERCIYMWDNDAFGRSPSPRTALHETTHLINHHLARQTALRLPVWFEEGTATYFETYVPARSEPPPNLARLVTVAGELKAGQSMGNKALRTTSWATFHSREYAWSCALVRFLRSDRGSKPWHALLEHLRKSTRMGAGRRVEANEFAHALSYKSDEALDELWHRAIAATKLTGSSRTMGASKQDLEDLAALRKPTKSQALLFERLGRAFAETSMAEAAVAYLEAALRGGVDGADLRALLARAIAERARAPSDEPWPAEALEHLRAAVEKAPLTSRYRTELGHQLLLRAQTPDDARRALQMLGLALLLVTPEDDEKWIASLALSAAVRARPEATEKETLDWLESGVPSMRKTLRHAWIYHLQAEEMWDELVIALEERLKAASASFENRVMLAGLYLAGNRFEASAALYTKLLNEKPDALRLWPHLIRALVQDGRLEEARAAKTKALAALAKARTPTDRIRRVIERIRIR